MAYLNAFLVINQDGQPLYDRRGMVNVYLKKSDAEKRIKRTLKMDTEWGKSRSIVEVKIQWMI